MAFVDSILAAAHALGPVGYAIVFLVALLESIVLVGTIVPGSLIVIFFGFLAAGGMFVPLGLILCTWLGAVIGDTFSFWLGGKGTRFFKGEEALLKESHLGQAQAFFRRHGSKSVLLGRFVSPLRPVVPFVAGLSRMRTATFIAWSVFSAGLWAVVHVLVGYFLGDRYESIEDLTIRAVFALLAIVAAIVGIWYVATEGRERLERFRSRRDG
jgi:membrane protein DedA with SNARE-associated domain